MCDVRIVKFKRLIVIATLWLLLCMCNISFANGPGEIPITSKKIAVVGDSYAGLFVEDEGIDKFEPYVFPVGGIKAGSNIEIFERAINADNNYILFTTGVNDQALDTDLDIFEYVLREHIKKIEEKGKRLFLHTYMDYQERKNRALFKPKDYDDIFRKLAAEFENVYYIDMSGMDQKEYGRGDGMHYNTFFNDTLKAKLFYLIDILDTYEYNTPAAWISIADSNQIAVTGDEYATLFYLLENNKGYELLDFSAKNKNIIDNINLMLAALSTKARYVLISLGAKDYMDQVKLSSFENMLRILANKSCETHKAVYIHTYMDYKPAAILKNRIEDYDNIIKKVANEYPNICYVNMHPYESREYMIENDIIFNSTFYDLLYNAISTLIEASKASNTIK